MGKVQEELSQTQEELKVQTGKLQSLNTNYLLSEQKGEQQASQLAELKRQVQELTQERDQLAQKFGQKDKESQEHDLRSQQLQEQLTQSNKQLDMAS